MIPLFLFVLVFGTTQACETAIIGAGIGGAYSAFRLSEHRKPNSICIFEAKQRPGGRILSVDDPHPNFPNYTIDLGAYRFHRSSHRFTRLLAEDVLGIETQCYTDPLEREKKCPEFVDRIFSSRGRVVGRANGKSAEAILQNPKAIPYKIGSNLVGANGKVDLEDALNAVLFSPQSVVKEIGERIVELADETNYEKAMQIADDIFAAMKGGSYRGIPYADVSVLQVLVAEGFSSEEIQYYIHKRQFFNFIIRLSVEHFSQLGLRELAFSKDDIGLQFFVTPVERRGGQLRRIGMKNLVHKLLDRSQERGVKIEYGKKVTSVTRAKQGSKLVKISFADGKSVVVKNVIMNIGKPDLMALGMESEPIKSSGMEFRRAVERNTVVGFSKTYCFWEDAWWMTKLGASHGHTKTPLDPIHFMRYHDGNTVCKDKKNLKGCRGGLSVSFNYADSTGIGSGLHVHNHNDKPYTPLTNTDNVIRLVPGKMTGIEELYFNDILEQIRNVHKTSFSAIGMDVGKAIPPPEGCIMADWRDVGIHVEMGTGRGNTNVYKLYTKPVEDLNIALVNEAWSGVQAWAEGSLHSAERALHHTFGLEKPDWLDDPYWNSVIVKFNQG